MAYFYDFLLREGIGLTGGVVDLLRLTLLAGVEDDEYRSHALWYDSGTDVVTYVT